MRTDIPVPVGAETVMLSKWLPDTPKPPPGVLVFLGRDKPEEYDLTALALAQKGFVVALIRPHREEDIGSMKSQYDVLKNQYKAIPFFAAAIGEHIPVATRYAGHHPKDFYGMIWIDPVFSHSAAAAQDEPRSGDLFERSFTVLEDETDIHAAEDSVHTLPPMPLAVFTDDLKRSASLLSDISQDREITLQISPRQDDPAYRLKALVRQLHAWHLDRVDQLVQTKRGALRWDREQAERE